MKEEERAVEEQEEDFFFPDVHFADPAIAIPLPDGVLFDNINTIGIPLPDGKLHDEEEKGDEDAGKKEED